MIGKRGVAMLFACATACALVVASPPVTAGPIGTSLPVLRQIVKAVVIGTVDYKDRKVFIDVERVVHGDFRTGRVEVGSAPDASPDVKAGERALLLLDENGKLVYAGSVVAGSGIEQGVLLLRGFSDQNMHFVEPGVVSLDQLTAYLRWGTLMQQVDATLAFPDGKGGLLASTSRFSISSDPIARTTGVMRLPAACLEGRPSLSLASGAAQVSLRFAADCPAGKSPDVDRALLLEGKLTGVDPVTGAFMAELAPSEPFVGEKEFALFAKDPAIAGIEQALGVRLESGAIWTWRLGVDLSPPAGPAVAASGLSSGAVIDTYSFGSLDLVIAPHARVTTTGGHARSMLEIVDRGPLETCELREDGKAARPCTLLRKPQRWVRIKR